MPESVFSLEHVPHGEDNEKEGFFGCQIGAKDVCCLVPQLVVDHQMNYAYVCGIITKKIGSAEEKGDEHTFAVLILSPCRDKYHFYTTNPRLQRIQEAISSES